jgi:CYTH domain-containing protein/CHAD domain-containing protein
VAAEIERKFLLSVVPDWLREFPAKRIEQGYLAITDDVEVRLRKAGEDRLLTVKRGAGEVREELEVELEPDQFEPLWPLTESRRLAKVRHLVPVGGGLEAEVDVFDAALAGLVVAEVEFGSERQALDFEPPPWLGEEVTGDDRYAGRRLAVGGPPGQRPRRPYRLKREEDPIEGVRRIARGRAEKALEELGEASGDELAASIHGGRKDLKKLRAVLRLVRVELGGKRYRAENRRYRDAGRLLSGSRDAEVKLETLEALEKRFGDEVPADDLRAWSEALEADRERLSGGSGGETAEKIERARVAIERGRDEIADWPLRTDSWKLLAAGLERSYRQGRKRMRQALVDPSDENVHRWRKRAKDSWYQLRIVRKAWPGLLDETADRAHELADLLGDHHDLVVLREDFAKRGGLGRGDVFAGLIERRQEELLDTAFELGKRFYAEKPGAFVGRLASYWKVWRGA